MDDRQVKSVDVTAINDILAQVGRLRFDTILIRNLVFIVNLYRSVRMKLQRDLVYSKAVILRAPARSLLSFTGTKSMRAIAD